jgi:hypothetical protein
VSNQSERVPAGKYRARAMSGDFGESAQKKTPFVRVGFAISDGVDAAGETVAWTGYFTENTTARTIDSLRFCGCTFPERRRHRTSRGLDTNEVEIVVEHEPYQTQAGETTAVARQGRLGEQPRSAPSATPKRWTRAVPPASATR